MAAWRAPDEQSGHAEFLHGTTEDMDADIRRATRTGRPFGTDQFVAQVELRLKQRLRHDAR